jgi:ribonuclease P protein component, eubacterial
MLPPADRLTRPDEFRRTIRGGKQVRRRTVVVYGRMDSQDRQRQPRVGITVSKAVGGSVVRHRVARVLRHRLRPLVAQAPLGSTWVVRALPTAGRDGGSGQASVDVARDLESAFEELLSGQLNNAEVNS